MIPLICGSEKALIFCFDAFYLEQMIHRVS
jgi:hypothetical protein